MRRLVSGLAAAVVLAGCGYVVADALDVAPGWVTVDQPGRPPHVLPWQAAPTYQALPEPSPVPTGTLGAAPTAPALAARLGRLLTDPRLGPDVGVSVRDGVTGTELLARSTARPRVSASLVKLLSAFALERTLPLAEPMRTRAVLSRGTVVLVAGGDTLLAPGRGDPAAVAGRAGLDDLASRAATALLAQGRRTVTVRLDLSYAAGPLVPPSWDPLDVRGGFTRPVAQVGLATDVAHVGKASAADPAVPVAQAFVVALRAHGVTATLAPRASWDAAAAPGSALAEVEGATYGEVLELALAHSDNALVENLVRQAVTRQGGSGSTGAFVAAQTRASGLPVTGLVLTDGAGLGKGSVVPVATFSELLRRAVQGRDPVLRRVVADLPVGALSGTLADRFLEPGAASVRGIPRAKTGTLTGVSALAGTTVDADGRLLTYVVVADRVPVLTGTDGAREALDALVAALTRCGCS